MLGRDGSTGYPGKNTTPVAGRPLMAWPLLAAKSSKHVERSYVSTDSPKIREVAKEYGARLIDRPPELWSPGRNSGRRSAPRPRQAADSGTAPRLEPAALTPARCGSLESWRAPRGGPGRYA